MGAPAEGMNQQPPSLRQHYGRTADNKGMMMDEAGRLMCSSPMEATYTALIQQYLAVYCLDNATFYAERFVASCSAVSCSLSSKQHSVYLLAVCYYRQGKPQRARSVLLEMSSASSYRSSSSGTSSTSSAVLPKILYLLAQCHMELGDYSSAEEALLRQCRQDFQRQLTMSPEAVRDMNEYILTASPCPIPNGAVGLHLLGTICQKSHRKGRAMQYYRMAIQLDPMMWISFEAMCEMGVTEQELDPRTIFGVSPLLAETMTNADQQTAMDVDGVGLSESVLFSPPTAAGSASAGTSNVATGPNNNTKSVLQPMMEVATPMAGGGDSFSSLPTASLFHSGGPSARGGAGATSTARPLFHTPNLTPIAASNNNHTSTMDGASFSVPATAGTTASVASSVAAPYSNPRILRRARQVASRRYYEPSPEVAATPIVDRFSAAAPRSLFLNGLDAEDISAIAAADDEDDDVVVNNATTPFASRLVAAAGGRTSRKKKGGISSFSFGKTPTTSTASLPTPKPAAVANSGHDFAAATPLAKGGSIEEHHQYEQGMDDMDSSQKPKAVDDLDNKEQEDDQGCVEEILSMLCILGSSMLHLGQFRSKEAIDLFNCLPSHHFHTGYVMHQMGRAYFEMADYPNSIRYLQMMEQLEPHRMKGLEVLSTALWQMKREVELSHLAQRVTDFDRHSPEVWCVVGNCFSMQKEHETALTFFRRSIQLDPSFTYSHTLSGHEHFTSEDFDKAIACYRDAIRADERHYNAWYGLGAIYHCQEKYDLSEYHFQRACKINPQSSVLICHLGMAQNGNGKPYAALETLQQAFRIDPRNPQAHYQRALVYRTLERPQDALAELEKVRDAAPKEAQIYFFMGRLHKRLGNAEKAMRCFLSALDLDPKDSNLIKAAMEKLNEPESIEEEVSAF